MSFQTRLRPSLARGGASLALALLVTAGAAAQDAPATDIYLVPLERGEDGFRAGAAVNVTDRDGYDNQPFFLPDGSGFLYTSIRDGQADIYRYDLESGSSARVTVTPESEYSPTVTPDGEHFSVVRVETQEPLVQRLWRFDLAGSDPRLLLEDVQPVGYHAWCDETTLALFVLGEPNTLVIADLGGDLRATQAESIGRCLRTLAWRERLSPVRRAISYVDQSDAERWTIRTFELDFFETRAVAPTLPGSEHHVWTQQAELLMAHGAELHVWSRAAPSWHPFADLSSSGLTAITRLALSPDESHLAVVAARPTSAPEPDDDP